MSRDALMPRAVCPNCGEETRERGLDSYNWDNEELPHAGLATCVKILRDKLEEVINRLDNHRL